MAANRVIAIGLVAVFLLMACTGERSSSLRPESPGANTSSVATKRIVAAVLSDPPTLISKFQRTLPGSEAIEFMVGAGLGVPDDRGEMAPVLAETIPSLQNGLWKLLPDGRMETTWTLRPNLQWHDGAPLTSDDLLFTAQVGREDGMLSFRHPGYVAVESVEALGARTVMVT